MLPRLQYYPVAVRLKRVMEADDLSSYEHSLKSISHGVSGAMTAQQTLYILCHGGNLVYDDNVSTDHSLTRSILKCDRGLQMMMFDFLSDHSHLLNMRLFPFRGFARCFSVFFLHLPPLHETLLVQVSV